VGSAGWQDSGRQAREHHDHRSGRRHRGLGSTVRQGRTDSRRAAKARDSGGEADDPEAHAVGTRTNSGRAAVVDLHTQSRRGDLVLRLRPDLRLALPAALRVHHRPSWLSRGRILGRHEEPNAGMDGAAVAERDDGRRADAVLDSRPGAQPRTTGRSVMFERSQALDEMMTVFEEGKLLHVLAVE